MLSRTADSLYWLARYSERAENIARMLDVSHRSALVPTAGGASDDWAGVLAITGNTSAFAERFPKADADSVVAFLVLDPNTPSSISSCLRRARENGRAVRGAITTEMWEVLNETWLEMQTRDAARIAADGVTRFCDWVKERSHLFRGVTMGTMLRDDAFQFLRLGTFLERADNTARLLDVKYHALLPQPGAGTGMVDYYQWAALLRSVSALRAYNRLYHESIHPARVAELLVLRDDMPRSLIASYKEIDGAFKELRELYRIDYESSRLAGEMYVRLRYGRMADIVAGGLRNFLNDFIARTGRLGDQISRDFQLTA